MGSVAVVRNNKKRLIHIGSAFLDVTLVELKNGYILSLGAFGAGSDREFHGLIFLQAFVTCSGDGAVMHEDIFCTRLWGNETKTLFTIEPFDGSDLTFCHDMLIPF
jgi:hypothetical protein